MRLVPKYSLFQRAYLLAPFFLPKRVIRFRRSKWLRLQRLERKLPRRRKLGRRFRRGGWRRKKKFLDTRAAKLFVTYRSKRCFLHKWGRGRFLYKSSLLQKRRLVALHDGSIQRRLYAAATREVSQTRVELFARVFVRPEFRLDLVLWRLQFYNSVYSAQVAIRSGCVWVNGINVKKLSYLRAGDIVVVCDRCEFKVVTNKYRLTNFLPQFFEVDYYRQCFVVLKGWKAISFRDANMFLRVPLSLSLLRFFFRNKFL